MCVNLFVKKTFLIRCGRDVCEGWRPLLVLVQETLRRTLHFVREVSQRGSHETKKSNQTVCRDVVARRCVSKEKSVHPFSSSERINSLSLHLTMVCEWETYAWLYLLKNKWIVLFSFARDAHHTLVAFLTI